MTGPQTATPDQKRNRRGLLTPIGAGGVAALAGILTRRDSAQAGHNDPDFTDDISKSVHIGVLNWVDDPDRRAGTGATTLFGTRDGEMFAALNGSTHPSASGVLGAVYQPGGSGVLGTSFSGKAIGVKGLGRPGVLGQSTTGGAGVRGEGKPGVLAFGSGSSGTGVKGQGKPGVYGVSPNGAGVRGDGTGAGSTGVYAKNTPGRRALRTRGKVQMDCARRRKLANKSNLIALPSGVKAGPNAVVLATVQGDPGNDAVIWRAFRVDGSHIRITFTKKPANSVSVAYWVVHAG